MPQPSIYRARTACLVIGLSGGALFYLLKMPLPWMLGAMCATTIAAVSGIRIALMPRLRLAFIVILGVMLGSAFTPDVLRSLGPWFGSFCWLLLYVVIATFIVRWFYLRIAGYDPVTAYFSAAPGGLSEMILAGSAFGGDERRISLSHGARILIAVFVLSFGYRWFGGAPSAAGIASAVTDSAIGWFDWLTLILCGLVGVVLAKLVKLPAYALVGPMLLSAVIHAAGITHSRPPVWLVAAAQVVVGSMVGARFDGVAPKLVLQAMGLAIIATIILLGIATLFGGLVQETLGIPFAAALLAFAPGGLAEMSLIALSLDVDAAYVSSHHIVRIFLIVVAAPIVFRLLSRR